MRNIYSQATKVLAWLGPAGEVSEVLERTINTSAHQMLSRSGQNYFTLSLYNLDELGRRPLPSNRPGFSSVLE